MLRCMLPLFFVSTLAVGADEGLTVLQPRTSLEKEIIAWQVQKRNCYGKAAFRQCMTGLFHNGAYIEGLTWNHRNFPDACNPVLDERGYLADDVSSEALETCFFAGPEAIGTDGDPSSARRLLYDCLVNGMPEFNPYFDSYIIYSSEVACSMDYRDGHWGITQMTVRG